MFYDISVGNFLAEIYLLTPLMAGTFFFLHVAFREGHSNT